ncbi:MAG: hypothetical protein HY303_01685 [Candidatus Wallbacteria bacterium]|nr:hypothetical protein [Candidatus Wallbacteria bacterium]
MYDPLQRGGLVESGPQLLGYREASRVVAGFAAHHGDSIQEAEDLARVSNASCLGDGFPEESCGACLVPEQVGSCRHLGYPHGTGPSVRHLPDFRQHLPQQPSAPRSISRAGAELGYTKRAARVPERGGVLRENPLESVRDRECAFRNAGFDPQPAQPLEQREAFESVACAQKRADCRVGVSEFLLQESEGPPQPGRVGR